MVDKYHSRFPDKPTNFLEVGCWFGQSATYMIERLSELSSNSNVFFLDSWLGGKGEREEVLVQERGLDYVYNAFRENIQQVGYPGVHIIRDDSVKGADNFPDSFFDFIFIDAGHRDWQCYNDIMAYYPKLKVGGTIAGHDIDFIDVERSVDKFTQENNLDWQRLGSPDQCWKIYKDK